MLWALTADIVVIIHFAFILFVAIGGWVAWKWKRVAWIHLPAAVYAIGIELIGWTCPLTPLEIWLRLTGSMPPVAIRVYFVTFKESGSHRCSPLFPVIQKTEADAIMPHRLA